MTHPLEVQHESSAQHRPRTGLVQGHPAAGERRARHGGRRNRRCGLCGSDVTAFKEGEPYPPFLPGHEWGGTVPAGGDGVHYGPQRGQPGDRGYASGLRAGARCAAPMTSDARACLARLRNLCAHRTPWRLRRADHRSRRDTRAHS
ncbi:alcohol dehydrogenase catalytic domain-containing protein [Streptomyces sp. NPDC050121]|uniref:alcohol dehydrogenase catalytic domain-containing protein n=1 Tax=Streptomyces sp. NPDC050121 TaxID=3365601 RepID=UPI00379C0AD7